MKAEMRNFCPKNLEVDEEDEKEQKFNKFCRAVKRHVREDRDAVIVVTGAEGMGKSALGLRLGLALDDNFTIERNVMFDPDATEFYEKLVNSLPKYSVIVFDESMKMLYKRGWQAKDRLFLNTIFSICRKQNKIFIMCIPNFLDLDAYYRNWRALYWVHVIERGYAVVFEKKWHQFSQDPWSIQKGERMLDSMTRKLRHKEVDTKSKDRMLSFIDGYQTSFTWYKPDPVTWREYKRKTAKKIVAEAVVGGKENKKETKRSKLDQAEDAIRASVKVLNVTKGYTALQISTLLGMPKDKIRKYLREAGLEDSKPFRRKNYF